jgi:FO synthase subunit 1
MSLSTAVSAPSTVTFSPAYTLVPTYECFNRCTYCNFRVDPGKDVWLSLTEAKSQLQRVQAQGAIEILLLSGEVHPQNPQRREWLQRIYDLAELAISLGLLPHTNVGPLSFDEMSKLKAVNVSMGLMLEQVTPRLLETVHRHAPSKVPQLRLQQLAWAGELGIPFTTGLLLGIGETPSERWATLEAIAEIQEEWGHIQEVILQPHSPGNHQVWQGAAFAPEELIEVIATAHRILPNSITLQIPPNLIHQPDILLACLAAGARDLGGIGPRDEVNPDYAHPEIEYLTAVLAREGWHLAPRLPIYPQYDAWLPLQLQALVKQWRITLATQVLSQGTTSSHTHPQNN